MEEDALWNAYWKDRTQDKRNALVLEYLFVAHSLLRRYERSSRDLLYGYAVEGLINAVERYDASLGSFKSYAFARVRGAIKDGWREIDVLPRSARDFIAAYVKVRDSLAQQKGHVPSDNEIVDVLDLTDKTRYQMKAAFDFGASMLDSSEEWLITDKNVEATPHEQLVHTTVRDILGDLVSQLPEELKVVVTLYYYEDMNLKEIGGMFGVTESRICQIHRKALGLLREQITDISLLYSIAA